jgi:hypothetical protein
MVISLPSTIQYSVGDTVYLQLPESAVVVWPRAVAEAAAVAADVD